MTYQITIAETDQRFPCQAEQDVLAAMGRLGLKGIPVGCRGGGCGVCRVQVLAPGRFRTLKMSRAQVSASDREDGICLACKLIQECDLTLRPLGPLRRTLS